MFLQHGGPWPVPLLSFSFHLLSHITLPSPRSCPTRVFPPLVHAASCFAYIITVTGIMSAVSDYHYGLLFFFTLFPFCFTALNTLWIFGYYFAMPVIVLLVYGVWRTETSGGVFPHKRCGLGRKTNTLLLLLTTHTFIIYGRVERRTEHLTKGASLLLDSCGEFSFMHLTFDFLRVDSLHLLFLFLSSRYSVSLFLFHSYLYCI